MQVKLEALIQKHWKMLVVIAFIAMIANPSAIFNLSALTNVVNPGFEGAKINCYGVNLVSTDSGWTGTNTIHVLGSGETELARKTETAWTGITYTDTIYWGPGSGPSQQILVHDWTHPNLLLRSQLETQVESNIQLQDFNYQQSIPLNLPSTTDPSSGLYLQYTHLDTVKSGSETTYNLTKTDILLVQGNFHIDIFMPPSQDHANPDSGWEEGQWSNFEFWYVIYWYDWLNSLGSYVANDPYPPDINASAYNRNTAFQLRGGFPISGWIQQYMIPIQTDTGKIYDLYEFKTSDGETLAGSQLDASIKSSILANTQLSPSLNGRYIDLYTQPSNSYALALPSLTTDSVVNYAQSHVMDAQTQFPAEYFKIGVNSFGTYSHDNGFFGLNGGYTIYYPVVSYLLRFVFGVYGTHTYVWTESTAQTLGYPEWENRTMYAGVTAAQPNDLFAWFSDPFHQLWVLVIIGLAVFIIIEWRQPQVMTSVLRRGRRE